MFNCAPEDPYTKWDKVWLDRARVVLRARQLASIDSSKKKIEGEGE